MKTLISKIAYSPETIKIQFISHHAEGGRATEENPAPPMAGRIISDFAFWICVSDSVK